MPDRKSIRGLDPNLYQQAKESALHTGKTLGEWLNQSIESKLKKEAKGK